MNRDTLGYMLIKASEEGDCEFADLFIKRGADVNARGHGETPLMRAAVFGHLQIVELLIANNADVNAVNEEDGFTALMCAAYFGHLKIVEILMPKIKDVNARNWDGETALTLAISKNNAEIIAFLQQRGVTE
jgi:ankyrin repeat protein